MSHDLLVLGLGTMGSNIARNFAHHDFKVAVFNRTWARTEQLLKLNEPNITGYKTLEEAIAVLKKPRIVLIMVTAEFVDNVVDQLKSLLEKDDVIIDGGNSHWPDTERRQKDIEPTGVHFVGMGISGGEEGALNGPAMMFGGHEQDWEACKRVLLPIAAKAQDGTPCVDYMGRNGAGHFVKMVHNAIEYADMQLIAETYHLMKNLFEMQNEEMADVFSRWNEGVLKSYLIEITSKVLRKKENDQYIVDLILDTAEQKGTGKWTSQDSFDIPSATPAFAEAVYCRILSCLKEERVAASKSLTKNPLADINVDITIDDLEKALFASKILCYAQGLSMIQKHSSMHDYGVEIQKCARCWRGGCIIRAAFLNDVSDKYTQATKNLLNIPFFSQAVEDRIQSLRKIVLVASLKGFPAPLFSSCLSYFDSYISDRLPANIIQGLRDFFGAHTYERIDKEGKFHTEWEEGGAKSDAEQKDAKTKTAGSACCLLI